MKRARRTDLARGEEGGAYTEGAVVALFLAALLGYVIVEVRSGLDDAENRESVRARVWESALYSCAEGAPETSVNAGFDHEVHDRLAGYPASSRDEVPSLDPLWTETGRGRVTSFGTKRTSARGTGLPDREHAARLSLRCDESRDDLEPRVDDIVRATWCAVSGLCP